MDEYVIVPKRMVEQNLAQIQINKEPPEAKEVLNLDVLIKDILQRPDISEWEKADQLSAALQRFLALKPKAFGQPLPVDDQGPVTYALPPPPRRKVVHRKPVPNIQSSPAPTSTDKSENPFLQLTEQTPSKRKIQEREAPEPKKHKSDDVAYALRNRNVQVGTGRIKWICMH